jgi:hypothetical protein
MQDTSLLTIRAQPVHPFTVGSYPVCFTAYANRQFGALGRTRTYNQRIRNPVLYPIELQKHCLVLLVGLEPTTPRFVI